MSGRGTIVAIDGPAGAGKSTVSRALARRFGYVYVDTGAMYRVVALLARERGITPQDGPALGGLAATVDIHFEPVDDGTQRVLTGGRDVTTAIRTQEIGDLASRISTHSEVRERLVALQRRAGLAAQPGAVLEGRDIGTVVFPDADVKIFLDASVGERATRRMRELRGRGLEPEPDAVHREITERDHRDRGRPHSPLREAPDAERVDTTGLAADEVVTRLAECCESALRRRKTGPIG